MFSRLRHLLSEFRFAFESTASLQDAFRLAGQTVRFHLYNWTKKKSSSARTSEPAFHVQMQLGDRPETMALRTFAGDLFVVYEIFMGHAYFVTESLLPVNDVRIIIDCGANIGLTSIYLANRYPNARVIAVEPHPDNFALLKFNTAHKPRILPVQACVVGESSGDYFISVDRESWGNTINQSGAGIAVASKTIAELLDAIDADPNDKIDLLKVDIEGAEEVLFAHPSFLVRTRMVIIELHGDYGVPEFQKNITPFGFQVQLPYDGMRMITAQRSVLTDAPSSQTCSPSC